MALYRAMCNCGVVDDSVTKSQLLLCNSAQWPVGHDLLSNNPQYLVGSVFAIHYARLAGAYWAAEPRELSYLRCIPKDMLKAINANLISVNVTKTYTSIARLGIAWAPQNVPYMVTFNRGGGITTLEFNNFVCNGTVGKVNHNLDKDRTVHYGTFASGMQFEYTITREHAKPEIYIPYMEIIAAGFAEFKGIVRKHTGIDIEEYYDR